MSHHRPRRHWGQHFLHDPGAIGRIVAAIGPSADDHLVEIGPGEGALTRPLARGAGRLDVVEIDRDLARHIEQDPDLPSNVRVHVADALRFDFRSLAQSGTLRAAGNLPYNISTPLLFHLLDQRDAIADMHFMLQREVVARLAAPAGDPARGRLSVMIQAYCGVQPLFHLGPGAFRPPPKVESSVVRLIPRAAPAVESAHADRFAQVVRLAFGGRRKTLRRSLAPVLTADAIAACGVDPGLRPQRLQVAEFAALAAAADNGGKHGE